MTQENHVLEWLEAYLDGELKGGRLHQVEAHLQVCEDCRAELQALRQLSALLQAAPPVPSRISSARFADQVRLRLPSQSSSDRPVWEKALRFGWQLVPIGLVGAWACLQAIFWIGQTVLLALNVPADLLLSSLRAGMAANVPDLLAGSLFNFRLLAGLGFLWLVNFYLTATIAILFWGWLAGWWIDR